MRTDTYHDAFGTNQLAYKTSSFGSSRNNGFRTKQHDSGNKGFSPSGFAPNSRSIRPGTSSTFSSHVQGNQFNNVNSNGFRRKQGPGRGLFSSVTDEPPILDYFSYHDPRIDWDALFEMEESNSAVLLRLIHLIGFASVNAGTAVSLYQEWNEGDGTYFDSKGEGSCQISTTDPLPPAAQNADFLAALNVEQYLSSAACGMCFRVQGDGKGRGLTPINGDYIVYVQDLCPSCKAGDMDLMAVNGDGRWDIRIKAVQCPVRNTFIQYWLQGSNAWYIKLQVRNTRVPCKEVHVQARTGQWKELNLTRDGHWAGSARLNLGGDVAVRLTSINGAVLDDIIPRLENHVVMEGKLRVQFPLDSSLPDA
ncbi:hypothetical protein V1264_007452 [Littorina saxatilis]|uniref:Expansin-like EG45 domain-containing protein n=2 Tax=Littorina saxatilis TaxID=31220 RepID=A0AAN9AV00_9CAEN